MNILGSKQKTVEIDGRRFVIQKFDPVTGLIIGKTVVSKILPAFQSFLPMIQKAMQGDESSRDEVFDKIDEFLNFESLSKALDLVSPEDLEVIVKRSLMVCYEQLPGNTARVLNPDGSYGVQNVEDDILIAIRLVCEAILWGVGDFFDVDRSVSILKPLSSSLPQSQKT